MCSKYKSQPYSGSQIHYGTAANLIRERARSSARPPILSYPVPGPR